MEALFDPDHFDTIGMARATDPETSAGAAIIAIGSAGTNRRLALLALHAAGDDGLSDFELADLTVRSGCGIQYGLDRGFVAQRRDDHQIFYCPNGHSQYFPQENETEKLRKDLERTRRSEQWQRDQRQAAERDAETQRRGAAAARGQLTKIKNRITNGVCPVAGCKRSGFDNVREHIATVHPDYHAHEVAE